jgi:hypothetical protein
MSDKNLVVVLSDGETWDSLEGCRILRVPESLGDTAECEQWIVDHVDTKGVKISTVLRVGDVLLNQQKSPFRNTTFVNTGPNSDGISMKVMRTRKDDDNE